MALEEPAPCPLCGGKIEFSKEYDNVFECAGRCGMEFTFTWHGHRAKYLNEWNGYLGKEPVLPDPVKSGPEEV